jgi:hypothetical protein
VPGEVRERGSCRLDLEPVLCCLVVEQASNFSASLTTWNNAEISMFSAHHCELFAKYAYYLAGSESHVLRYVII